MGGHYHDDSAAWAEPVSLDPTPVWKQGVLVGVLLLVSLIVIALISIPALLPTIVSPPAAVPGGRVILAMSAMPPVNGQPIRVGPDLAFPTGPAVSLGIQVDIPDAQTFYIAQPAKGEFVAVRARWTPPEGSACEIAPTASPGGAWRYGARCRTGRAVTGDIATFGLRGEPVGAPRSLERYLVSVDRDRVIVNISRVIESYGATPQPRVSPLATP